VLRSEGLGIIRSKEFIAVPAYIYPHIHMVYRVTDDYQRMAQCGCVAISEPAFWAGSDRGNAAALHDYVR
jgi:predicted metal-dependent TIM-barrel fold hydrolase